MENENLVSMLKQYRKNLGGDLTKHFLALEVIAESNGKVQREVYSGFLLELHSHWFWISARHCIEKVNRVVDSSAEILAMRWHDQGKIKGAEYVPFAPEQFCPAIPAQKDWDVGFVAIDPFSLFALKANPNLKPVKEKLFGDPHALSVDDYYLLGLPADWRKEWFTKNGNQDRFHLKAGMVMLVSSLDVPPEEISPSIGFESGPGSVFGKVSIDTGEECQTLSKIHGMSGGPVFGVKISETGTKYWLSGIVVQWAEPHQLVRVESITSILAFLKGVLKQLIESRSGPT